MHLQVSGKGVFFLPNVGPPVPLRPLLPVVAGSSLLSMGQN